MIFEIYKVLINYLNENFTLPENILLRLLDEDALPLRESLTHIAILHGSFVSMYTPRTENNG